MAAAARGGNLLLVVVVVVNKFLAVINFACQSASEASRATVSCLSSRFFGGFSAIRGTS